MLWLSAVDANVISSVPRRSRQKLTTHLGILVDMFDVYSHVPFPTSSNVAYFSRARSRMPHIFDVLGAARNRKELAVSAERAR
jgi:hypothetical protein